MANDMCSAVERRAVNSRYVSERFESVQFKLEICTAALNFRFRARPAAMAVMSDGLKCLPSPCLPCFFPSHAV